MRRLFCVAMMMLVVGTSGWAADWLTDGGNPQRTAWQQDEHILNKDNVRNIQILWKINLGNEPREMHSLLPTLVASNVPTADGPKEITITAGVSDNIYAVDADTGKLLWKKHFEHSPPNPPPSGTTLCPGGQTATPVIGPARDSAGNRTVYAVDGGGNLRQLNLADGKELASPIPYSWPNGKSYALNLWKNVIFTTTAQGCGGNPNQFWAIDVTDPQHKVMTFNPGSGGLWGRTGAALNSEGTAYAPTGDGIYDPESEVYGNGLVGVKIDNGQLKLQDYFIPKEWAWMRRRDLDMNVTPAVFNYRGRELMVTSSKECRIWLLDASNPGGIDHQTPLYRTPLLCNEEVNYATGVWGSLATWEDSDGTRWILSPFWGPAHPNFEVPVNHGPVVHGAIVAFKLEESDGNYRLVPAWMSRDMDQAEPPVIANGVVFAYASGENATTATPKRGLDVTSPRRIALSTHATLYALDAQTGEVLYSSGDQITSWNHFTGLSIANGRVYIGTFDSTLYAFGVPESLKTENSRKESK